MTTAEIGNAVRELRVAQGLRQVELAAASGVGLRFLVELERGKPTVQLGKAMQVLDALGYRFEIGKRSRSTA